MKLHFKNREQVGIELAEKLKDMVKGEPAVVLGLPRGGVPIASIIAKTLNLEFNIYVSKKIPHPQDEEFAIGAIGEFGEVSVNPFFPNVITKSSIENIKNKINSYINKYRKKPLPSLESKIVILADDGIATGLSMMAAIKDIQQFHPKKILAATGVAAQDTFEKLNKMTTVVALIISNDPFFSVGMYYEDFHQLTDQEVERILSDEQ
ncbi:Phosphoribosyl transferase domain protein [Desulfurella amilsii]|uniref:Phosphoribosyl transferase domain protein n=1 Tax=Desulfurella amilsii TaxID=1562698 RepID=A0A1X4XVV7_9BACT|nr:phosphoribosyltransferase family protein [Desulfurella amilsii]OSS41672.1 Phosphoribosyl transferase domain protein [Desulfurella amilsii]